MQILTHTSMYVFVYWYIADLWSVNGRMHLDPNVYSTSMQCTAPYVLAQAFPTFCHVNFSGVQSGESLQPWLYIWRMREGDVRVQCSI